MRNDHEKQSKEFPRLKIKGRKKERKKDKKKQFKGMERE